MAPDKKKRAVIWAAVSTRAQANEELYSLPAQEEDSKALAERMGWDVIDVLTIPGHSRRYIDIHECAKDMAAQGINAFLKLMQHWRDRDFDVLIVRDGDRFARTQTLHAHVTETTIDLGAIIYSLQDGEINEHNYRLWIAMSGYKSAGDVDRLVTHLKRGVRAAAENGLTARNPPMSHRKIRNPDNGKTIALEVIEELLPLWRAAGVMMIEEGIGYGDLETELFKRGFETNGRPYSVDTIRRTFLNPIFWGHTYTYPYAKGRRFRLPTAPYILEEGHEVPEGVSIFYNKFLPVLTGPYQDYPDFGAAVKDELIRRMTLSGNTRPHSTSMFADLIVCGECGASMSAANERTAWKCYSIWQTRTGCNQRKQVSKAKVMTYVNRLLTQVLDGEWPPERKGPTAEERIDSLTKNIEGYKKQIRTLIQKQARVEEDSDLSTLYDEEIRTLNKKLKRVQDERDGIAREPFDAQRITREFTIGQLRNMQRDAFWSLPELQIQQHLKAILGEYKLIALNGEIVRVAATLPKGLRHQKKKR